MLLHNYRKLIFWQNLEPSNLNALENFYLQEETYLNIIKAIYDKPTANIILSGEKLKAFIKI